MEYRQLGKSGVRVSPLCLGAMNFGGRTDEQEGVRIVHEALDAGVNFIDTANVYTGGRSEQIVGQALKDRRDDVVLATKVFSPIGRGPNDRGTSRAWLRDAPGVTAPIIGPRTAEQLKDALASLEVTLDEGARAAVDDVVPSGMSLWMRLRGGRPRRRN